MRDPGAWGGGLGGGAMVASGEVEVRNESQGLKKRARGGAEDIADLSGGAGIGGGA